MNAITSIIKENKEKYNGMGKVIQIIDKSIEGHYRNLLSFFYLFFLGGDKLLYE